MFLDKKIQKFIVDAYKEDIGLIGDITTDCLIEKDLIVFAEIFSKQDAIISGQEVAQFLFEWIDQSTAYTVVKKDSDWVNKGDVIATIEGPAWAILQAERTVLNFLQHLSGVASLTHEFIKKMNNENIALLDTRKTIPNLRVLQRKAVVHGGGVNHRLGLYDQILIKENHLTILASKRNCSISEAIKYALKKIKSHSKDSLIEIEVQNKEQALIACDNDADIILLDNMSIEQWKDSVQYLSASTKKVLLEASGNVSLENISAIAQTGVDRISVGSLTSSLRRIDLSLLIKDFLSE